MKTIVIYKSKTGFTRKYAEWISEELSADIFDISNVNDNMLSAYDTIIYGGSLYAVGIIGVKYIKQNLDKLKDKKVIVFATGASLPSEAELSVVKDKNFTSEQQKQIHFFYLRGGFNYSKLNPFDKVLMTLLKLKLKVKKNLAADERGMLASYNNPVDFTQRRNIVKLITFVNS